MSLSNLVLKNAYDTGNRSVNVIEEFYIPILGQATSYKRLTGYFSSQVLALAARGVAGLIKNGGKMQLITSPAVSEKDFQVLKNFSVEEMHDFVDKQFEIAMANIYDLTTAIAYDHLRALGWMLREGFLEIRVLVPRDLNSGAGIFHSKVGIIEDNFGNLVSFSGSVNETAGGWLNNIEEFKVFKSWEPATKEWVDHDLKLFNKYWDQGSESGFEAIPLSKKSAAKLIAIAPEDFGDLDLEQTKIIAQRKPRSYQIDALKAWVEHNFNGIFEMATGTGKTFTARMCIDRWKEGKEASIVLVTAPTQTIGSQWAEVLDDLMPVTTFGKTHWKTSIRDLASSFTIGVKRHIVIIAIQNTASSKEFLDELNILLNKSEHRLIVSDEVHGLGAPMFRNALNPNFNARLGLTATPNRWFDDDGTKILIDFFSGVIFVFGLHEALTWIDPDTGLTPLSPYNYYPEFADLDSNEMDEYIELTRKIIMESFKGAAKDENRTLQRLQEERASILKKAKNKFIVLRKLLSKIEDFSGTLIYCSDREQMNQVIEIIQDFGITYRSFTGDEGTLPIKEYNGKTERDWILESFEANEVQALIAMKCLDEGVDIPSARLGIIMASTTNPREFIQRRGRLLRRHKNKDKAHIYDMIVAPLFSSTKEADSVKAARHIFQKELERVDEFSRDALNAVDVSSKILDRMMLMGSGK